MFMRIITRIFLIILSVFFPKLRKVRMDEPDDYQCLRFDNYSRCYCNSGKKYVHCHLPINEDKGKVAIRVIDKKRNSKIILVDPEEVEKFLGDREYRIEVKNTFSETEVAVSTKWPFSRIMI